MGTLEEKGKIVSLSSFNAHSVMGELNIAPDMKAETTAIRFVHSMLKNELRAQSSVTKNHAASEITIEKVSFRYDLFRSYADEFFAMEDGVKMDALSTAVICDEFINHANEPLQPTADEEENDAPVRHRDDGFDIVMLTDACLFYDEAQTMEQTGIPDDEIVFEKESYFLAHVNVIENLRDIEESFDDYTIEDLIAIRDKDFTHVPDFIRPDTQIGQVLQGYLAHMGKRIDALREPAPLPQKKKPRLTLVPTQP